MKKHVAVIGAGPAGLACARTLLLKGKDSYSVTLYEKENQAGGLAKTIVRNGYRFDIGGHRFYTKIPQVKTLYQTLLGNDMLVRKRMSRIYYQGKYYSYPLELHNVITNIGFQKTASILISYVQRQFHRYRKETNFAEWVSNRFGDELFSIFFKSYTEKVWGIPTSKLSAQWAKQRIQNFSLPKAVISALLHTNPFSVKTIISEFLYPKLGPGMFYEKMAKEIRSLGGIVRFNHDVIGFRKQGSRLTHIEVKTPQSRAIEQCDAVVTTMPLHKFLFLSHPPKKILRDAKTLRFRSFIAINFIIRGSPFPDNWIYIHDPSVRVGRIQNYANWSSYMTKDARHSPITMEYFCNENDEFWNKKDEALIRIAQSEAENISLFSKTSVSDGFVVRVPDAYPIYSIDYDTPLRCARTYLESFSNLFTCGRGGLFRYNNMDHSMMTGMLVAENILDHTHMHNVWNIHDETYLEEKN